MTANEIARELTRKFVNEHTCVGGEEAAEQLRGALTDLTGRSALIVGDAILDRYLWCTATRISPEAPVPVAKLDAVTAVPGGCSNVAANVSALGGHPIMCTVLGDDEEGASLSASLAERGVGDANVVRSSSRLTTTKTRIIAHSQQMLRVDREQTLGLDSADESALLSLALDGVQRASVCVLSDYAKGCVTPKLCAELLGRCREVGIPTIVDPKGRDFHKYRGATLITPNTKELAEFTGREPSDSDDEILVQARELMATCGVSGVLVTRGARGVTLATANGQVRHTPSIARQVYDVTGAGDTVVAALALALGAGVDFESAALLATVAAGIVVAKVGTSDVTTDELATFLLAHG